VRCWSITFSRSLFDCLRCDPCGHFSPGMGPITHRRVRRAGLLMILTPRRERIGHLLAPIFMVFVSPRLCDCLRHRQPFPSAPQVFKGASRIFMARSLHWGSRRFAFILLRATPWAVEPTPGLRRLNGVSIAAGARVQTGKKTMFMMATSLAFTAGGHPPGLHADQRHARSWQTMNAVPVWNLFGSWTLGGWSWGRFSLFSAWSRRPRSFRRRPSRFSGRPPGSGEYGARLLDPHAFRSSRSAGLPITAFIDGPGRDGHVVLYQGNITMLVVMYSSTSF